MKTIKKVKINFYRILCEIIKIYMKLINKTTLFFEEKRALFYKT